MSVFDALRDAAWDDFSVTIQNERAFALELVWCAPPAHAASDARWAAILSCGLEDAGEEADGKPLKLNHNKSSRSADIRAGIFCGVSIAFGSSVHTRAFIPLPPPFPLLQFTAATAITTTTAVAAMWSTLPDIVPAAFDRILVALGFRGLDFATGNRARVRDPSTKTPLQRTGVSIVCRSWAQGWFKCIRKAHAILVAPRWRALSAALSDPKRIMLSEDAAGCIAALKSLGMPHTLEHTSELISAKVARWLLETGTNPASGSGTNDSPTCFLTHTSLIAAAAAAAKARLCGEPSPLDPGIYNSSETPDEALISWLTSVPRKAFGTAVRHHTLTLPSRGAAAAAAGACASRVWAFICVALHALRDMGALNALRRVEMPAALTIAQAQRWGIGFDRATCARIESNARSRISALTALQKENTAGSTTSSSSSVSGVGAFTTEMYAAIGLVAVGGGEGGENDDGIGGGGLSRVSHTSAAILLHCPRLHAVPRYAITGRISLASPPLQALSVSLRGALIASPGCILISGDFATLEVRILAHFSGDAALRHALRIGARDVFEELAERGQEVANRNGGGGLKIDRGAVKTLIYVSLYGGGDAALANALGTSISIARSVATSFSKAFPGVEQWKQATQIEAGRSCKVRTLAGRVRSFANTADAHRLAISARCQGSAADVFKVALARVALRIEKEAVSYLNRAVDDRVFLMKKYAATGLFVTSDMIPMTRIVLHIHDEIVLETPIDAAPQTAIWLREEMTSAGTHFHLSVPLPVKTEAGLTFGDQMQTIF